MSNKKQLTYTKKATYANKKNNLHIQKAIIPNSY